MTDQQQGAQAQEPPQEERITLAQHKQIVCKKLVGIFSTELMEQRLLRMVGGDASRLAKYLTSFLAEITEDKGSGAENSKKYYCQCSLSSLTMCFLESVNMQLPFDSRKLVAMVIYDWEAELDISYKGFINALYRHYSNAYVDAKIVMDGDDFTCEESAGHVSFKHKQADPFPTIDKDMKGVRGAYCYFSYTTENGATVERMVRVPRADLMIIRSKARTKKVWDEFTSEQILKAVIRRASKIPFAAIDLDVDIEEVANKHFQLDAPEGGDRLLALMQAQEEVLNEKPKDDAPPVDGGDKPGESGNGPSGPDDSKESTPASQETKSEKHPVLDDQGNVGGENVVAQNGDKESPDEDPVKESISDADFEDIPAHVIAPSLPAEEEIITQNPNTSDQPARVSGDVWDGHTIIIAGKPQKQDFASSQMAFLYLKKVMVSRKHKASRLKMIEENNLLIAALIRDGQGGVVAELHKIAAEGA